MAGVLLSEGEKTFILHGVKDDFRNDGRGSLDYRPLELETDIVTHANGSARLRLANTDILVAVKTEVDVPLLDRPQEGKIEFFVDCSANATPEFEGRGGEDLGTEISNCLMSAYQSKAAFDLSKLCILPGVRCWKLFIDILILECGGNLFDAVSMAVKAALYNTRLPRVKAAGLDGGAVDLELSDDPFDCVLLDTSQVPVLVTLCKIGDQCVVDPTAEEEECSVALAVVAVTPQGLITTTVKLGDGSFSHDRFYEVLKMGTKVGKEVNESLEKALKREQQQSLQAKNKERYGFLK